MNRSFAPTELIYDATKFLEPRPNGIANLYPNLTESGGLQKEVHQSLKGQTSISNVT